MDQATKDRITAELAAEYRETIRQTAARDDADRRGGYGTRSGARSISFAYFIWFTFGEFGIHRIYLGRIRSGALMLGLGLVSGAALMVAPSTAGLVLGTASGIWWLADAFLIPGMLPD